MRPILALLIALISPAIAQPQRARGSTALDDGIKLLGAGRLVEAVAAFNRFKQTAPGDAGPYFYAGIALGELGRLSAAAQEVGEAVRIEPNRPEYRVFQANVLSRLRQTAHASSALGMFERKAVLEALDTAWLRLLAEVYARLERHDSALEALELLRARNPADARVDLDRGKIHLARGELDLAAASFRKSIAQSSNNPAAHLELGKLLQLRSDFEGAKRSLLESLRQAPKSSECLLKLGLVALALGQREEALGYLKRAEPAASSSPQIYYALGNAYQALGDRARAVAYRKKYQEISQTRRKREDLERAAGKLIEEGEGQLDLGRTAEARALFAEALRLDPDNWDAHGYLAESSLASGELQQAHEHLMAMQKVDPDSAVGNYLMAKYAYARGEYDRARAAAEKVKSFRPAHAELRSLLGDIYLRLGLKDEALREYEAAVQLAPERGDFRKSLQQIKP